MPFEVSPFGHFDRVKWMPMMFSQLDLAIDRLQAFGYIYNLLNHIVSLYSFANFQSNCTLFGPPARICIWLYFYSRSLSLRYRELSSTRVRNMPVEASICMRPGYQNSPTMTRYIVEASPCS